MLISDVIKIVKEFVKKSFAVFVFYIVSCFWKCCACVDNWSRLHTKLVSLCPDFTKDSEACSQGVHS